MEASAKKQNGGYHSGWKNSPVVQRNRMVGIIAVGRIHVCPWF